MKFVEKISDKLYPVAAKMNSQRHLTAIRDGFIITMPLIMAASFSILLNALLFSNAAVNKVIDLSSFAKLAVIVNNGTLAVMGVLVCYNIGYNLGKWYIDNTDMNGSGLHPTHTGGVSLAIMFMMVPISNQVVTTAGKTVTVDGIIPQTMTSSTGLFLGMIAALLGTELLVRFSRSKRMRIMMPDGVPPAIARSFNSMIPEILVVMIFAIFIFLLDKFTGLSVPELVSAIIQAPLNGLVRSAGGMIVLELIADVLWAFGMHGANILAPLRSAPLLEALQQNMDAFAKHASIPNIITQPFMDSFSMLGGGGAIMALILAIFIGSKRSDYKTVARLGFLPSLFNIAEPMMFGLPVVMNPVLMIPVMFVPSINLIIAYFATSADLVSKTVVQAPWITPPVIQAYLATAGDWRAGLLAALLLVLDVLLWLPFVLASNKVRPAEEA